MAFSPDLIGITANTCVFDSVIKLIEILKSKLPDVPIIIGGPHPSAMPERSLQETKTDFVAIGEGELAFEEMVACLKEGKKDWSKIKGLAYRDKQGNVLINQPRELIHDLDILPFPARDLVKSELTPHPQLIIGIK